MMQLGMVVPLWVDMVEKLTPALLTLVIGTVASTIAFFQYRISSEKLRLDLFSKRLEAYEKLQEFFILVLKEGCVKNSSLPTLREARYKSRFLFGSEIEAKFKTLWKSATEMMTLRIHIHGEDALPVGPARTAAVERESYLLGLMLEEMEIAPERYSRYLHFK